MNECVYDHLGTLVDDSHPYAGCKGTPDQYDSRTQKWNHFWHDSGGIWHQGWRAFWASREHDMEKPLPIADPDSGVSVPP